MIGALAWRLAAVGVVLAGSPAFGASAAPRWAPLEPILVWIEDVRVPAEHIDMVERALRTWSAASEGAITFRETREFPFTGIRIRFVKGDVVLGEAMPSMDRQSGYIVRGDVVLSVDAPGDALQRLLVLYLTALHEIGHALGLAHTDNFSSIMYRFRRPGDPERFFLRYRQGLRSVDDIGAEQASGLFPDDTRSLRRLYGR